MAINLGEKKKEIGNQLTNHSKTLTPGNELCTITGVSFRKNDFKDQDGYDVYLDLVGKDLSSTGFEGFFIDKDKPELGRYHGPVGKVALTEYSFADKVWPARNGKAEQVVNRDAKILQYLGKVATIVGKFDALFIGEVENIEDFMNLASDVLKGSQINLLIAGKEYEKGGYTNFNLFIPKTDKGLFAMEAPGVQPSKLQKFDQSKHMTSKKKPASLDSFETSDTEFAMAEPVDAFEV